MIWENVKTAHHRWMVRYLRKRGWVVFYLEREHRKCSRSGLVDAAGVASDLCWLQLYVVEDERRRESQRLAP